MLIQKLWERTSARTYRCQLSDLFAHVTPRVKAPLNNVSLMRNAPSHEAAGPGQNEGVLSQKLPLFLAGKFEVNRQRQRTPECVSKLAKCLKLEVSLIISSQFHGFQHILLNLAVFTFKSICLNHIIVLLLRQK